MKRARATASKRSTPSPLRLRRQAGRRKARRAKPSPALNGRRDILERAAKLMQQKGYGGVSAQDIADALEFSKANFFYHVRSKEELLYHIFVEPLQLTIRHVEEILARQAPAVEKLHALIDLYVQLMTDHTAVMLVWFKERSHLTPEHQAEVIQLERRIQGLANKFYADAIHRGEFRAVHPSLARISIFGMCFMLCRWPHFQDELSVAELKRQLQELACGALLRPPE